MGKSFELDFYWEAIQQNWTSQFVSLPQIFFFSLWCWQEWWMDFLIQAFPALCWEGLWGLACTQALQEGLLPLISDVWLGEDRALLCPVFAFLTVENVAVGTPSLPFCSGASSFRRDHFTRYWYQGQIAVLQKQGVGEFLSSPLPAPWTLSALHQVLVLAPHLSCKGTLTSFFHFQNKKFFSNVKIISAMYKLQNDRSLQEQKSSVPREISFTSKRNNIMISFQIIQT